MKWLRLSDDVIDDPKVQKLPAPLFKIWVNLLCLANKSEHRGLLPDMETIAFRLRISEEDAESAISELAKRHLIDSHEEGLSPHNWTSWQSTPDYPSWSPESNRERVRRHRADKKLVTEQGSNPLVTSETSHVTSETNVTSIDVDVDRDKDVDTERDTECVGDAGASGDATADNATHTLLPSEIVTPAQERRNAAGRAVIQGGSMQGEAWYTELVSLGYAPERINAAVEVLRKARSPDEIARFSARSMGNYLKSVMDKSVGKDWLPPEKRGKTLQDDRDAIRALLQEAY